MSMGTGMGMGMTGFAPKMNQASAAGSSYGPRKPTPSCAAPKAAVDPVFGALAAGLGLAGASSAAGACTALLGAIFGAVGEAYAVH